MLHRYLPGYRLALCRLHCRSEDSIHPCSRTLSADRRQRYRLFGAGGIGLISSAEGSFVNSSGVISESGYVGGVPPAYSNAFFVQLNSNYFSSTPLCSGAADPSLCQGWQQFMFAQGNGYPAQIYMQYWLINYRTVCPTGWYTFTADCYTNSPASNVPNQSITSLPQISLQGNTTSVSPGTTIQYLFTEISGQPCTYGFRATMYGTASGNVQSPITDINFQEPLCGNA